MNRITKLSALIIASLLLFNSGNPAIAINSVQSANFSLSQNITETSKETNFYWIQSAPIYGITEIENTGSTDFDMTKYMTMTNFFGGRTIVASAKQTRTVSPGEAYYAADKLGCTDGEDDCDNIPWIGLFWITESFVFSGKMHEYRHLMLILPWWVAFAVIMVVWSIILYGVIESHRRKRRRKVSGDDVREDLKDLEDHTHLE